MTYLATLEPQNSSMLGTTHPRCLDKDVLRLIKVCQEAKVVSNM
jgi:hypothetical protein